MTLEDIRIYGLMPPKLTEFGIKRAIGTDEKGPPDLITVWKTPYPVLTKYELLCRELGIKPYAGGTREQQGPEWKEGHINSGFRDHLGAKNSAHFWGMAIDVVFPDLQRQIDIAKKASKLFMRVGIYPDKGIMHFDQAPVIWQMTYRGVPFWVTTKDRTRGFYNLAEAIKYARVA